MATGPLSTECARRLAAQLASTADGGRDPIIMPIKTFSFLDPVRDDARFHALLHKMRLE